LEEYRKGSEKQEKKEKNLLLLTSKIKILEKKWRQPKPRESNDDEQAIIERDGWCSFFY